MSNKSPKHKGIATNFGSHLPVRQKPSGGLKSKPKGSTVEKKPLNKGMSSERRDSILQEKIEDEAKFKLTKTK